MQSEMTNMEKHVPYNLQLLGGEVNFDWHAIISCLLTISYLNNTSHIVSCEVKVCAHDRHD